MKKLNVKVWCTCSYKGCVEVPDDMTFEEAIEYAKDHINDIPLGRLTYVPDSDELDEEMCEFEE